MSSKTTVAPTTEETRLVAVRMEMPTELAVRLFALAYQERKAVKDLVQEAVRAYLEGR